MNRISYSLLTATALCFLAPAICRAQDAPASPGNPNTLPYGVEIAPEQYKWLRELVRPEKGDLSTRSGTLDFIQRSLRDFDDRSREIRGVNTPGWVNPNYSPTSNWYKQVFDDTLIKAVEFRDALSNNPYVRVESFTVVIPWGIEFQFKFLDAPPTATATDKPAAQDQQKK